MEEQQWPPIPLCPKDSPIILSLSREVLPLLCSDCCRDKTLIIKLFSLPTHWGFVPPSLLLILHCFQKLLCLFCYLFSTVPLILQSSHCSTWALRCPLQPLKCLQQHSPAQQGLGTTSRALCKASFDFLTHFPLGKGVVGRAIKEHSALRHGVIWQQGSALTELCSL